MEVVTFEKALKEDVKQIMVIINDARKRMKDENLIQWQDGYPNKNTILNDINLGQLYKLEVDKNIAGICVINSDFYDEYPTHASKNLCQTIHRLAISKDFLNMGLGQKLLNYAEEQIVKDGFSYALIDTFSMNKKMMKLIKSRNFKTIGEFTLMQEYPNWVLYQKKLK